MNKKIWAILVLLLLSVTFTSVYFGAYRRTDDVSSVPCLGCLGLDPVLQTEFRFKTRGSHPDFVESALEENVVFLHYRTDTCSACDEMEPVVDEIEEENPQLEYFHINLDHAKGEKRSSFFTYDIKAEGNDITGVPMFVIMTKKSDEGVMKPYFKVLYGIHSKEDIEEDISRALGLYPGSEEFTPMVDLIVDQSCNSCPYGEEALLDMYDDIYFISYVTDAPGVSGRYPRYLQELYLDEYGIIGSPRAEFNNGEQRKVGATDGIIDEYRNITDDLNTTAGPVKLSLSMDETDEGYDIGYEMVSQVSGDFKVRVVLTDRYSPWKNDEGDPIPFAFVDNVFNGTFYVEDGEKVSDQMIWSGTQEVSLNEMGGDLSLFGIVYRDDQIIQTAHVPPRIGGIRLEVDEHEMIASPTDEKSARIKLINQAGEDLDINISAEDELGWPLDMEGSIILGEGKNQTVKVDFECPAHTPLDTRNNITVDFQVRDKGYLSTNTTISVDVKEDSRRPKIEDIKIDPEEPEKGDEINVEVLAVDNEGLEKVEVSYYVCTDVLCGPVITEEMNKTGKRYSKTIGPFDEKYTELHITIRAEDVNGNVNETEEYGYYFQEEEELEETPLGVYPYLVSLLLSIIYVEFIRKRKA